jgi:hypothetical protein
MIFGICQHSYRLHRLRIQLLPLREKGLESCPHPAMNGAPSADGVVKHRLVAIEARRIVPFKFLKNSKCRIVAA